MARLIVDSRYECLWLTRTARRPIYRPVRFEIRVAAYVGLMLKTLRQLGDSMAVVALQMALAFKPIAGSFDRINAGKSGIR